MKHYERLSKQNSRLGRWEGFSQTAGDVAAVVNSVGSSIANISSVFVGGQVATTQVREATKQAYNAEQASTAQLSISTTGNVQQAAIGVSSTATTYKGITDLILGVGVSLAVVILVSGFAYEMIKK